MSTSRNTPEILGTRSLKDDRTLNGAFPGAFQPAFGGEGACGREGGLWNTSGGWVGGCRAVGVVG
jgi:hypothetical protein